MGTELTLPKGAQPQFSAHVCCGQMAGWIQMPLVTEVGLGPGDFVLHGDPAPLEKRAQAPPNFRPMSIMAEWLDEDATWYGSRPRPIVLDGDPAPPGKGAQQPPSFGPCLLWPWSPISATAELLLHSSRQTVFILYNGPPFSPQLPLPMCDLDPSNT